MKDHAEFTRFTDALNRIGTDGADSVAVTELMTTEIPDQKVIRKVMDDMGKNHKKLFDDSCIKWFKEKCQQYLDFSALEAKRTENATRHEAPVTASEEKDELRAQKSRALDEQKHDEVRVKAEMGAVFSAMLNTFRKANTNTAFHAGIRPVMNYMKVKQAIAGDMKITVTTKELRDVVCASCAYDITFPGKGAAATAEAKYNFALTMKNTTFMTHVTAAVQAGWLAYNGHLHITEEMDDKGHVVKVTVPHNEIEPTYTMDGKVYVSFNTNPSPLEKEYVAKLFGLKTTGIVKKGKGANTTMLKANMADVVSRFKEILKGPLIVADRVGIHEAIDAIPADTMKGHLSSGFFNKYQPVLLNVFADMVKNPTLVTDDKLSMLVSLADAIDAVITAVAFDGNGVKAEETQVAA